MRFIHELATSLNVVFRLFHYGSKASTRKMNATLNVNKCYDIALHKGIKVNALISLCCRWSNIKYFLNIYISFWLYGVYSFTTVTRQYKYVIQYVNTVRSK